MIETVIKMMMMHDGDTDDDDDSDHDRDEDIDNNNRHISTCWTITTHLCITAIITIYLPTYLLIYTYPLLFSSCFFSINLYNHKYTHLSVQLYIDEG